MKRLLVLFVTAAVLAGLAMVSTAPTSSAAYPSKTVSFGFNGCNGYAQITRIGLVTFRAKAWLHSGSRDGECNLEVQWDHQSRHGGAQKLFANTKKGHDIVYDCANTSDWTCYSARFKLDWYGGQDSRVQWMPTGLLSGAGGGAGGT